MRAVLLLAFLVGCYLPPGAPDPQPGEAEAVAAAMGFYGSDARPKVFWAEGADLDCIVPSNGKRGFSTPEGCLEGWTWNPLYVTAALRPGDRLCDTALAHELAHNVLLRHFVVDRHHHRAEWWAAGGRVDQAIELLEGI